jgi:formate-dependent nitrite reductase cytochrome c552 subunit
MTNPAEDEQMKLRIRQAEAIVDHPEHYMVCEGCGSILDIRTVLCGQCHAYRFDTSNEAVTVQALLLASRPQQGVTPEDLT